MLGAEQGWVQLLADVVADGMFFGPHLLKCGCGPDTPQEERRENAEIMVQFTLDTISEMCVRFYPMLEGLPHAAVRLLHPNVEDHVKPAICDFLHQWLAILEFEELASRGVQGAIRVLGNCPQRHWALLRVFLAYLSTRRGSAANATIRLIRRLALSLRTLPDALS